MASNLINLAGKMTPCLTFLHRDGRRISAIRHIGPLKCVVQQVSRNGYFAMMILRDRAQRRGVTEVDCGGAKAIFKN